MKTKLAVLCSATLLAGTCWAASKDSGSHNLTDVGSSFLDAVATSDYTGIELSKAAAANSQSQAVRGFAQQMADDQSNNYSALQALSDKKKHAIAPQFDGRQAETLRQVQSANNGDAIDRAYLDAMITDQSAMESVLERIANNSNDSDIARFASDTLTMVKKHQQAAAGLVRD
jgi:putative membrane protein